MTTECYDLFLDGKITARNRDAVDQVGMHGAAVVQQHYLQRNQEAAARSSIEVSLALRSPHIGPVIDPTRPTCLINGSISRASAPAFPQSNFLKLPWGTLHSSGGDDAKKAKWDTEELLDLELKYESFCLKFPGSIIPAHAPVVPQLLKDVHADPKAVAIYAKRHIVNSGRLATGMFSYIFLLFHRSHGKAIGYKKMLEQREESRAMPQAGEDRVRSIASSSVPRTAAVGRLSASLPESEASFDSSDSDTDDSVEYSEISDEDEEEELPDLVPDDEDL